jgi:hypothetical protein
MATMIHSGTDVVAFLEEQHQQIEAGFDEVLATSGDRAPGGSARFA